MKALDILPKYRGYLLRGMALFVPGCWRFLQLRSRGTIMTTKNPTPVERIAGNIVGKMTCEPLAAICLAADEVIRVASADGIELSRREAFDHVIHAFKLIAFVEVPPRRPRLTMIQGGAS